MNYNYNYKYIKVSNMMLMFSFSAWMEVNYSIISKTEGIMHLQKEVMVLFLKQVKVTILKISVLEGLATSCLLVVTASPVWYYKSWDSGGGKLSLFTLQPNKRLLFWLRSQSVICFSIKPWITMFWFHAAHSVSSFQYNSKAQ